MRLARHAIATSAALIALAASGLSWQRCAASTTPAPPNFDGKPVAEVSGTVVEYPSGKPLAGVFVSVMLQQYVNPGYRPVEPVCAVQNISRTDAKGRYAFRWDWRANGMEIPAEADASAVVYQPGMTYWPRQRELFYLPSLRSVVQLARDDTPFQTRLARLAIIATNDCNGRTKGPVQAEFYRAIHAEYWQLYCNPAVGADAPLDYKTYDDIEDRLITTRRRALQMVRSDLPDDSYSNARYAWKAATRGHVSSYPWFPERRWETPPEPRDLTPDEKRQLCAALHPKQFDWSPLP
jgi:hypothetical protein